MRHSLFLLCTLSCSFASVFAQTRFTDAPIPSSPYELATGATKLLDTPELRASVLGLIDRAQQNNDLHASGSASFDVKFSFQASGNATYTGAGDMEETWFSNGEWRWVAHLGSYSQTRIMYGRVYDENTGPIPMRLHMLRSAFYWPLAVGPHALLRFAAGEWQGKKIMCVLVSGGTTAPAHNVPGRQWQESEYCIDTQSGLLQTYSPAPGLYTVYDYTNAIHFHNRTIAPNITVFEGDQPVLKARIDSLTDATFNPALFKPTEKMASQGSGPFIAFPVHLFLPAPADSPHSSDRRMQPVIVVAEVSPDGTVSEAEALPTADPAMASIALDLVRHGSLPFRVRGPKAQSEAFVSVRFLPAGPHGS